MMVGAIDLMVLLSIMSWLARRDLAVGISAAMAASWGVATTGGDSAATETGAIRLVGVVAGRGRAMAASIAGEEDDEDEDPKVNG